MSTREDGPERAPIENLTELAEHLAGGCKPKDDWRIGTEHEKFAFCTESLRPVPYDGPRGIRAILEAFVERFGWQPIMEGDNVIALKNTDPKVGGNVSLEPGGQLELSGAPLRTVHETCREVNAHLEQCKAIGADLGVAFMGLGFQPKWTHDDTPMMPKGRYGIMKNYMPKVGTRGLDMMFRSCTIQVNLDFGSEADMVQKMRVGLALQPIATAIFANSPFTEGKPNGFKSVRAEIWRDVDNNRAGMLPFAFEEGFGFERYVDYALDVPMYFVYRKGVYHDVTGRSFRDFLDGKLEGFEGERPTIDDWADHLSTIFPEVRLKQFLEMRGTDGGAWHQVCALPALWTGLLYDQGALDQASALIAEWTAEQRQQVRDDVPRLGLDAEVAGRTVQDVAKDMLAIARKGLVARASNDELGVDERQFLVGLERIVETGRTPADNLLAQYHAAWKEEINPVFEYGAF